MTGAVAGLVAITPAAGYVQPWAAAVIGIITAWNSPMALLANKLPAALAAGNCVVVKPSEHASATTLQFAKLVEEAGD